MPRATYYNTHQQPDALGTTPGPCQLRRDEWVLGVTQQHVTA